jgi:hypothetical protein
MFHVGGLNCCSFVLWSAAARWSCDEDLCAAVGRAQYRLDLVDVERNRVPCPSRVDRVRNRRRAREEWTVQTVAWILWNLRHIGRQV